MKFSEEKKIKILRCYKDSTMILKRLYSIKSKVISNQEGWGHGRRVGGVVARMGQGEGQGKGGGTRGRVRRAREGAKVKKERLETERS
jgi:hypothetical protein